MISWWVAVVYICLAFFTGMYVMWALIDSSRSEIPANIKLTISRQYVRGHTFYKFEAINEDNGDSARGAYIRSERRARKLANRAIDRIISREI